MARVLSILAATLMVLATLPAQALGATLVTFQSVSGDGAGHLLLSGGYTPDANYLRFPFTAASSDGGTSWVPTSGVGPVNSFASAMALTGGTAVRFEGANSKRSTDYGATWVSGGTLPHDPSIHAATLVDASNGWAVGVSGGGWTYPGQGQGAAIYRTTNGGSDWTQEYIGPTQPLDAFGNPVTTQAELHGVDGAGTNTAWAVGWQTSGAGALRSALAYKTSDGGDTWTRMESGIASYRLYTVGVPDASTAFIGGERNVVYKTVNGGSSWTLVNGPVASTSPQSIFWGSSFVSTTTGWFVGANSAGGGTIYKTTDGTTFVAASVPAGTPRLRAVYAVSATEAIAVGDNECVLRTTDGVTWTGSVAQAAPVARVSAPATGTVLTGTAATVSVAATDAGVGVAGVQVTVRRSDAKYWNGAAWQSDALWLASRRATGTPMWDYSWNLDPSQDRGYTYSVGWRAWDAIVNTATAVDAATSIRVDNLGPILVNAFQLDATHVQATFSEPLALGSAIAGKFAIDHGLSVSAAQVVTSTPTDVLLTTGEHVPGTDYILDVATDAVDDPYGNPSRVGSDTYRATFGPPVPFLTVSQGSGIGRPTTQTIVAPGSTAVVDEVLLSAHDGTVSVTGVSLAGTPTATFASDVTNVSAVADSDGNGVLSASDATLASVPAAGGTMALTFGSPSVVASGSSLPVWLVYRLAPGAADGRTVGSRVTSVSASQRVDAFSPIVSAASGRTLKIDAASPSVTLSTPSSNATLTGGSHVITGTVSDTVGVDGLSLSIRRSDSKWWTGVGWSGSQTWLAVAPSATWTYPWTLDAGQNAEYSYSIDVTATDFVGRTAAAGRTGVRVDNAGPTLVNAYEADNTHVRAVFSELLGPVLPDKTKFALNGGVTVESAAVVGSNEVELVTSPHSTGTSYTLSVSGGAVGDAYGNGSLAGSDDFQAFAAEPFVSVSQGANPGRPSAPVYVTPGSRAVVDEFVLSAHHGPATVGTVTVAGVSTDSFADDVSTVALVADTDRDGTLSSADTTLSSAVAAATNTLAFSSAIPSGTSLPVWVVYRLAPGAADGRQVGSQVTSVTATTAVEGFPAIISAAGGHTLVVDAASPTVTLSSPAAGAVLTGAQTVLSGTAADSVGLQTLSLSIRRSDGKWWDGLGWSASESWIGTSPASSWAYAWDLGAGQDGAQTFEITARATDRVGRTSSAAAGGIRVDNTGPELVSATESGYDGVLASFSETVAPGSIVTGAFTIAGLTVDSAAGGDSPEKVRLTTSVHSKGTAYTLAAAAGAVRDIHGNIGRSGSRGFAAVAEPPFLTAAQGHDPGRPTQQQIVSPGARAVVDEVVLTAHIGTVTVTGVRVDGLSPGTFGSVVSTAAAIEDTDRDGLLSSADTTLAVSGSGTASMTLSFAAPRAVSAGATLPIWIVYRLAAAAPDAGGAGSRVTSVAALSRVDPVPLIESAASSRTLVVDDGAPSVALLAPTDSSTASGTVAVVSGTASDSVGVESLALSIHRSDGAWWTGSDWGSPEAWVAVTPASEWTYDWSLDPGQNSTRTYDLVARVTDRAGKVATSGVTGVRVDNKRPTLTGAAYVDLSHVDVTFSELLDPASVTSAQFIVAPGVTVSGASAAGATVHLTVAGMAPSTPCTVSALSGLRDIAGNALDTGEAGSAEAAFVSGAAPPPPPAPDPVPAPAPAPVTPSISGHTLYTPVTPSTVYYGRSFTLYSFLKPRHKAGLYSLKYEGYRYERQSNGTYKWVRRATWYGKNYNYSTYTKCIKTGAVLKLRGKWRVRAVHTHTGYLPKYSGYRYFYVR